MSNNKEEGSVCVSMYVLVEKLKGIMTYVESKKVEKLN